MSEDTKPVDSPDDSTTVASKAEDDAGFRALIESTLDADSFMAWMDRIEGGEGSLERD